MDFDKFFRRMLIAWAAWMIVALCIVVAAIWVAIHFIAKYW